MFYNKLGWRCLLLTVALFGAVLPVSAAQYDEADDGDLSNDPRSPTAIQLDGGPNHIKATTMMGDPEYFTLTVPELHEVTQIILESYIAEADYYMFMAVQEGSQFKMVGNDPANETLGWSRFGPTYTNNGLASLGVNDVYIELNASNRENDTVDQLLTGKYTFMLEQDGNPTTYTLNFVLSDTTAVTSSALTSTTATTPLTLILITFLLLTITHGSLLHEFPRSNRG